MSFESDLTRYIRAHFRRQQGSTQIAVERLLRGQNAPRLSPAGAGPERPGQVVIGRPGDIVYHDSTPVELLLEHGFFLLRSPIPPILAVHHTDDLGGYLAGSGTPIPGTSELQYLIGLATPAGDSCSSGAPRYGWADDPGYWVVSPYDSQLYTSGQYTQSLLEDSNRSSPGLWSGLGRLWVQVCTGKRQDPADVVGPTGWTPDPETDGVLRMWDDAAETYRFYYVRAYGGGTWAVEFSFALEGRCALAWLAAQKLGAVSISDEDRRYMETWVLRSAYIDSGNAAPVLLLSSAEMDAVYDDGAPVAHGWHYSRQRIGTDMEEPSEASIVMLGSEMGVEDGWHNCTRHTITFSVVGGELGAVLSAGDTERMNAFPSVYPLWLPDGNGSLCALIPPGFDPGGLTEPATVYCFYDDVTGLQELKYTAPGEGYVAPEGEDGDYITLYQTCGNQSQKYDYRSGVTAEIGGYSIGATDQAPIFVNGAVRYNWTWQSSAGGHVFGHTNYSDNPPLIYDGQIQACSNALISIGNDMCGAEICDCWPYDWNPDIPANTEICGMEADWPRYEGSRTRDESSTETGGRGAVISGNDCEAVYLVESNTRVKASYTRGSVDYERATVDNLCVYPSDTVFAATMHLRTTEEDNSITYSTIGPYPLPQAQNAPNYVMDDAPGFNPQVARAYLVTSHGAMEVSTDFDGWDPIALPGITVGCTGWSGNVVSAYHSGGGWYFETPAGFVVTDDLPADPANTLFVPVGGA